MEFESVRDAARRFGVTVRAVQKWAAEGKISGAKKIGRDWFIPVNCPDPRDKTLQSSQPAQKNPFLSRQVLPLLSGRFPLGKSMEYINSIEDPDDRNIALGEYYYYTGQPEKSVEILEPYLVSDDPSLRYSAEISCIFTNIALGRTHLVRFSLNGLRKQLTESFQGPNASVEEYALGSMISHGISAFLQIETQEPPLENHIRYLSGGLKLWSCYILSYKAFQQKKYEVALEMSDLALALVPEEYPLPAIYCRLVGVMALVNLMRMQEAKERMAVLWKMVEADGFYEIIGEHYTELMGIIDTSFKKTAPATYDKIMKIVSTFGSNWIKLHNIIAKKGIADNLTSTEFTVAMLYNRGWSAQEIAAHLDISEHTVRSYIKTIYIKLGINDKKSLAQYMLK